MTKYTHDNDDEIAALYIAGESGYLIADRFGITDPTVYRALDRQGITRRPAGKRSRWEDNESSRRDLVAAYEAGDSIRVIARRLGTRTQQVMKVLDESGLGWRHPGGKRRFNDEQAAEFVRDYLAGDSLKQIAQRYGASAKVIRDYLARDGVRLRPLGAPAFWTEERKTEAVRQYEAGEQLKDIAAAMGCGTDTLTRILVELGVHQKKKGESRREAHHSWRGGRVIDGGGYIRVKLPDSDRHLADATSKDYVLEHRLVMARLLGRRLLKSETVHHVNGNRQDNRPENLQLRQGTHGTGSIFRCAACGSHNIEAVHIADA